MPSIGSYFKSNSSQQSLSTAKQVCSKNGKTTSVATDCLSAASNASVNLPYPGWKPENNWLTEKQLKRISTPRKSFVTSIPAQVPRSSRYTSSTMQASGPLHSSGSPGSPVHHHPHVASPKSHPVSSPISSAGNAKSTSSKSCTRFRLASPHLDSVQYQIERESRTAQLYASLTTHRSLCMTYFKTEKAVGGAGTVGARIFQSDPSARIAVMIAANSGLPGGGLCHPKRKRKKVSRSDLDLQTQEESVLANSVLSDSKKDSILDTIKGMWGLLKAPGRGNKSRKTVQKINYEMADKAAFYNDAYVAEGHKLSAVQNDGTGNSLVPDSSYPATFIFSGSVNANLDVGNADGSMQLTLNPVAVNDYDFFKDCIKESLRASIDAAAEAGITHLLVAKLSCGIYAGPWKDQIAGDFYQLLEEVLEEEVGPDFQVRGDYFKEIVVPKV